MRVPSWRLRAAVLAIAVVATASCGNAGEDDLRQNEEAGSPTTTAVDSTPTTTTTRESTSTTAEQATRLEVTVRDGAVVGGAQRERVRLGEPVMLVVDADVADEVHVHGYDHMAPVAPGAPAELQFTPDIPGVFEVELEELGLVLVRLEVA
ncbi:MAG: hypothetical protein KY439_09565 [Actinobacteria bacterium]|nr:hypothetical protein [Actinomycetota bacterium]